MQSVIIRVLVSVFILILPVLMSQAQQPRIVHHKEIKDSLSTTKIQPRPKTEILDADQIATIEEKRDRVKNETMANLHPSSVQTDIIYTAVEMPATFPGGEAALMKWLSSHLKYPEEAQKNGIQGKIMVELIVEKNGSISNAKIVRRTHPSSYFDKEVFRVVSIMPRWQPGRNNGQQVRSKVILPITFRL